LSILLIYFKELFDIYFHIYQWHSKVVKKASVKIDVNKYLKIYQSNYLKMYQSDYLKIYQSDYLQYIEKWFIFPSCFLLQVLKCINYIKQL
jgi:hypothetical protein